MANWIHKYCDRMMSQKKLTRTNNFQNETLLDNILWLIENFLPQKKKRSSHAEFSIDKFESNIINKIKKMVYDPSKSLRGDLSNVSLTFTIGNWALPYLKFLKRLKFLK